MPLCMQVMVELLNAAVYPQQYSDDETVLWDFFCAKLQQTSWADVGVFFVFWLSVLSVNPQYSQCVMLSISLMCVASEG